MNLPEKILIIRLSSIGDILLTFPLLNLIKRQYPDISIDYITEKNFAEILIPVKALLNEIIIFDKRSGLKEIRKLRKKIFGRNYPLILDLHNNQRSHLLTYGVKSEIRRMKKYRFQRFLYVKFRYPGYPEIPVSQKYIQTFPFPLTQNKFERLDFRPDGESLESLVKKIGLASLSGKKILIYPGARHFTKRWLPEYFRELIEKIIRETDYSIILGGGQDESIYIHPLSEISGDRIIDTSGRLGLYENFLLVYLSDIVLSNDSAPMHIAALLDKPLLAIFGNTVRRFGFYPTSPRSVIIEDNSVSCRPCSHIGFEKCPKGHFDCLRRITPEMVFGRLLEMLREIP